MNLVPNGYQRTEDLTYINGKNKSLEFGPQNQREQKSTKYSPFLKFCSHKGEVFCTTKTPQQDLGQVANPAAKGCCKANTGQGSLPHVDTNTPELCEPGM